MIAIRIMSKRYLIDEIEHILKLPNKRIAVVLVSSEGNDVLKKFEDFFKKNNIKYLIMNFAEGDYPEDWTEKEIEYYIDYLRQVEAELKNLGLDFVRVCPIKETEAVKIVNFLLEVKDYSWLFIACDEGKYRSQAIGKFAIKFLRNENYEPVTFDKYTYNVLKNVLAKNLTNLKNKV